MQTAASQIWDRARQIEKERVEAQHAKMQSEGKISKAEYNPEKVLQPWTWGSSATHSLHNIDPNLVLSVSHFDFDLNDGNFIEFLKKKSHLHMCRAEGSAYWKALNDHSVTKAEFLADRDFHFAQEYQGTRHKYSEGDLLSHWKIFHFTKVFLQGAYDNFKNRSNENDEFRCH